MGKQPTKYSFNIVHHLGEPNEAVTLSGHKVSRSSEVYVQEAIQLNINPVVKCEHYDNHFVYLDPEKKVGSWFAMCTCGSPAAIVDRMKLPVLACLSVRTHGQHQTKESRWV